MKPLRPYALAMFIFLAGGALITYAQIASTLTVGNFTIAVPASNPTVLVNAPGKSGTLALKEDLPTIAPGSTVFAGQFAASGAVVFNINTPPVCALTPRFITTATGLQLTGVDYVCTAKTN